MTVYVDDMRAAFRGMTMCHLIADTEVELHVMADVIGIQRRWYQGNHYDIALSKRALVVAAGAQEITLQQPARAHRMKVEGVLGPPEEAIVAWVQLRRMAAAK